MTRRTLLTSAALIAPRLAAQEPTGLDLFLLVGQSNMAGRGVVEDDDKQPMDGVLMFDKDRQWRPAVDPLHFDKPVAGVGIGRSFARRLREANPKRRIGLIPSAVGGTSLDQWKPGDELFTIAVSRAKAAMPAGTLRGILWHQGEADSSTEALASSYRERFAAMIAAMRGELGATEAAVVVGQLGPFFRRDFSALVNQQLAIAPLMVPRVGFVSSAGLMHKGDDVHFDAASLREFGRRYALAYLALDPDWEK